VSAATGPQQLAGFAGEDDSLTALRGATSSAMASDRAPAAWPGGSGDWAPTSTFAISVDGERRGEVERMARRLAGRSVGVVLSAAARGICPPRRARRPAGRGMLVDRVGGVSMGAFIGGLLAAGHDSAAIDACCYEEWVRRNPINDYTLPRKALIKGNKAEAMLERTSGRAAGGARAVVLLREREPARQQAGDRSRRADDRAVGASISLP